MNRRTVFVALVSLVNGVSNVDGFFVANPSGSSFSLPVPPSPPASSSSHRPCASHAAAASRLLLQKRESAPDGESDGGSDDDDDSAKGGSVPGGGATAGGEGEGATLVTREMLHRDLLEDPHVKRKRRNGGGYRPLDNRDHLPFAVRKITPDPYTHSEVKKAKQKREGGSNKRKTPTDLDYHLSPSSSSKRRPQAPASTTSSRLYQSNNDGTDTSTLLGEFQLDKSTTSGDVIVLGEKEYQVQSARCQYKYAGGQRFVMVRKILEVKEVTRVYKEEAIMRQYKSSPSSRSADQPPQLE
jgi:hypothetical protein